MMADDECGPKIHIWRQVRKPWDPSDQPVILINDALPLGIPHIQYPRGRTALTAIVRSNTQAYSQSSKEDQTQYVTRPSMYVEARKKTCKIGCRSSRPDQIKTTDRLYRYPRARGTWTDEFSREKRKEGAKREE